MSTVKDSDDKCRSCHGRGVRAVMMSTHAANITCRTCKGSGFSPEAVSRALVGRTTAIWECACCRRRHLTDRMPKGGVWMAESTAGLGFEICSFCADRFGLKKAQIELTEMMRERDGVVGAVRHSLNISRLRDINHPLLIHDMIFVLRLRRDRWRARAESKANVEQALREQLAEARRELKRTQAALRFANRRVEQFRTERDKLAAREENRSLVGRLLGVSIW